MRVCGFVNLTIDKKRWRGKRLVYFCFFDRGESELEDESLPHRAMTDSAV